MGSVWVAEHGTLKSEVAVKLIASDRALSEKTLERFTREAVAASRVKSPHVVRVLDHGKTEEGEPYIIMELLEGRDLGAVIEAKKRLPPREVVRIVTQVAHALSKAHEAGIIHRDIKPSNIFLCDGAGEPVVKLLDFGVAKDAPGADEKSTASLLGTPHYMSPEQIIGRSIDHRADIWALGVVVYRALTGQRPFEGDTVGALTLSIHGAPPPAPSELVPGLPKAVDDWFAKACARKVDDRFDSAMEAARELARALDEEVPQAIVYVVPAVTGDRTLTDAGAQARDAEPPKKPPRVLFGAIAALLVIGAAGVLTLELRAPRLEAPRGATARSAPPAALEEAKPKAIVEPPAPIDATASAKPMRPVLAPPKLDSGAPPPPRRVGMPDERH
jgi:serine/threonine-protein kinase